MPAFPIPLLNTLERVKPRCIFSPSQLVGAAKIPKTGRDLSYAHVNLWSQFPGSLDPKTKEVLCCVSENVKGNNILPQKSEVILPALLIFISFQTP